MNISHPKAEEIEEVFDFMRSCDIAEYGEPDSDFNELKDQWGKIDLQRDAWILQESGKLYGYCNVSGKNDHFNFDLYTHINFTPTEWSNHLIDAACDRILELKSSKQDQIFLTIYTSSKNERTNGALLDKGFNEITRHFRMQMDLSDPLTDVQWPEEVTVRSYQADDEFDLYKLIETAFDWEGHIMPPIEDWRRHLFRGGRYDPEFFVLLFKTGKLSGAALSYNEESMGWIRQLAITAELRRQGLGAKMLHHMFYVFQKAGCANVGLGVESVNKNACEFYEKQGMRKTREFIEYRKEF